MLSRTRPAVPRVDQTTLRLKLQHPTRKPYHPHLFEGGHYENVIMHTSSLDNMNLDAMSAPEYGSRRRSSLIAAQVLEAIRETDEETYEETLVYDLVALGGGVATGYWGQVRAGK